jgi:uncharacterized protein YvpB
MPKMRVDLQNFFRFFDEKNPKHIAAVDQLQVDLEKKLPELVDDAANWVRIFRSSSDNKKNRILEVPFYPQTDNYTLPDTTCNSSACAMALEYLKPGSLKGERGDDEYLREVLSLGRSVDHRVQSTWRTNLSFKDLDEELKNGRPVVIGILHRGALSSPKGGHILVVIGKTEDGKSYIVNDPYGNLMDGYTTNVYNGKHAVYSKNVLEKRWTVEGPTSGWGRVFKP